jgi:hypothetical protein
MTLEGLGEMFEGDFANKCAKTFPLMLIGGCATLTNMALNQQPQRV